MSDADSNLSHELEGLDRSSDQNPTTEFQMDDEMGAFGYTHGEDSAELGYAFLLDTTEEAERLRGTSSSSMMNHNHKFWILNFHPWISYLPTFLLKTSSEDPII